MQQPLYGLIGGKLGHSYSKIIHEKIADYTYELLPLPTEAEARTFMEKRAFAAINVTIPYKQFVIPYCDVVDPKAQAIGAVNCIRRLRDGTLEGHNTDIAGLRAALDRLLGGAEPAQALVLGTGGRLAGRAIRTGRTRYSLRIGVARRGERQLHLRQPAVRSGRREPPHRQCVARGDLPRRRGSAANPLCLYHAGAFSARPGLQPAADSFSRLRSPARGARAERRDDVPRAGGGVVENMEYLKRDMNQKL